MPQPVVRRSLPGVLLSVLLLGSLATIVGDTGALAAGLGMLLLVGVHVATAVAVVTHTAPAVRVPGARRLRRQWARSPIPLLVPGLAGKPQPRAPGDPLPELVAY